MLTRLAPKQDSASFSIWPGMRICDSSGFSALIAAARKHAHTARAEIALAAVPAHTRPANQSTTFACSAE